MPQPGRAQLAGSEGVVIADNLLVYLFLIHRFNCQEVSSDEIFLIVNHCLPPRPFYSIGDKIFSTLSSISEHGDRLPLHQTLSQQCCAPRVCTKIPGSLVASSPDILIQVCAESVGNRHISKFCLFVKFPSCPPPSDLPDLSS